MKPGKKKTNNSFMGWGVNFKVAGSSTRERDRTDMYGMMQGAMPGYGVKCCTMMFYDMIWHDMMRYKSCDMF